jgi:predicted RNase H-related nuclease YkuK (DUF458 family)
MRGQYIEKIDMNSLDQFLENCSDKTKIYLGCDSRVLTSAHQKKASRDKSIFTKTKVAYTLAIVVHIDGRHGGKIFYEHSIEKDYSESRKKPSPRLMMEVYKVSELYLRMIEEAPNCVLKDIEIHLDISPHEQNKSSLIVNEAIGYVRAMTQTEPKIKPEAWAATTVADYF